MAISGIQSGRNAYETILSAYYQQKQAGAQATGESGESGKQDTDTVTLSQKAKELAQSLLAAANGSQQSGTASLDGELPLGAYALPNWFMKLNSDLLQVDDQVGIPYSESRSARYDALSSQEKDDLAEYQGTLQSYFQDSLRSQGIVTSQDYYSRIVQNLAQSEEVHQAVREKLMGNPRALQLMGHLGITL